jgi:hypothetical protein
MDFQRLERFKLNELKVIRNANVEEFPPAIQISVVKNGEKVTLTNKIIYERILAQTWIEF